MVPVIGRILDASGGLLSRTASILRKAHWDFAYWMRVRDLECVKAKVRWDILSFCGIVLGGALLVANLTLERDRNAKVQLILTEQRDLIEGVKALGEYREVGAPIAPTIPPEGMADGIFIIIHNHIVWAGPIRAYLWEHKIPLGVAFGWGEDK